MVCIEQCRAHVCQRTTPGAQSLDGVSQVDGRVQALGQLPIESISMLDLLMKTVFAFFEVCLGAEPFC